MDKQDMSRRDFQKLALAAMGGLAAGAGLVAAEEKKAEDKPKNDKTDALLQEPHICRGLNTCKGKGKGGKNECAGTSACATAKAHTCAGENACRGLGGCGETAGENKCKAMGKCHVPLTDKAWGKVRKHFEEVMTKAGHKVGEAPKKG